MKLKPLISIIICTNRAPESIDQLFLSICRQPALDFCEVILVDNGIVPSRVETIRRLLSQLQCRSIYLNEPRPGLWHARRSAFANANGDWLMLLDDDNEIAASTIEHLLSFIEKHPETGCISPRVVAKWERLPASWLQRFGTCCLSFTESGQYSPNFGETVWTPPRAPELRPPGGGMIIHRQVAEVFLECFSLLPDEITKPTVPCEDHAIYCCVGRNGLATAYVPTIIVYHSLDAVRTTLATLTRLNFRMMRGYGRFSSFESIFTRDNKGWVRRIVGFLRGEVCLMMPHPKSWWLVLVRLVAFLTGVVQGMAVWNTATRRSAG